jgi:hypothetical protein
VERMRKREIEVDRQEEEKIRCCVLLSRGIFA